eukprot:1243374-Pleurochrysis_carterae.AAC.2
MAAVHVMSNSFKLLRQAFYFICFMSLSTLLHRTRFWPKTLPGRDSVRRNASFVIFARSHFAGARLARGAGGGALAGAPHHHAADTNGPRTCCRLRPAR